MALVKCRTCGKRFNPKEKKVKAGYINQCRDCSIASGDLNRKYLGRSGAVHKGANIEIFRKDLKRVKAWLNREKGAGMSPNLGIGHPNTPDFSDKE